MRPRGSLLWEIHAFQLRALVPHALHIETAIAGLDYEKALKFLQNRVLCVASHI
jgi:hypothetical protein